jgi:CRP-like cAMP-binding protein
MGGVIEPEAVRRPSADDLRKLKDDAAEAAAKGKLDAAADLYREAAEADPRDVAARQKLAEVLRRAGRTPEAIRAYRDVADGFGRGGLLIKAIAISKAILELDPGHVETQSTLAALYARKAEAEGARPPPRTVMVQARRAAPDPTRSAFARIQVAAEEAAAEGLDEDVAVEAGPFAVEVTGDEPLAFASAEPPRAAPPPAPAQPRVPIFSDLSREAFLALTAGMVLCRVADGEPVVREGEDGTSFYVVASGRFAVSKRDDAGAPVALAHLGEGDFFGEMALLSGAPRAATVTAEQDGEVLELRADVLLEIARRHPHLARTLRRFYRQRLLANAMAVSPVFRPFQKGERKLIMERFRAREAARGETIVREGDPSDGLYVVLEGAVDVVKRKGARSVVVGQLREGDLFGEMSCLRKTPASASVVMRRAGTLLRLPRHYFDVLVVTHPQILELVATLSEERAENLDAILSGHAQWTEEGLVLT